MIRRHLRQRTTFAARRIHVQGAQDPAPGVHSPLSAYTAWPTELETNTGRFRAGLDLLENAGRSTSEIIQRLRCDPAERRSVQRNLAQLVSTSETELTPQGRHSRLRRASALNTAGSLAVHSAARMLFHRAAEYNEQLDGLLSATSVG